MKVGIFFGGASREREVSFSGGRTVYDNLDKSLFQAVPLFVDSFNNIILLNKELIYKGSIRDFYPPIDYVPASVNNFQLYVESLEDKIKNGEINEAEMIAHIGRKVSIDELPQLIDVAFLALHGTFGEDGTLQGLLEWLKIPYTGSGILASGIGISKAIQKRFLGAAGFDTPDFLVINRRNWEEGGKDILLYDIQSHLNFPVVIKPANQGSSIGVSVVKKYDAQELEAAVNKAFFCIELSQTTWQAFNYYEKTEYVRALCDIREGLGLPLLLNDEQINLPENVLTQLENALSTNNTVTLQALQNENEVLVEEFVDGREFSCIVVRGLDGNPVALPPTEIVKGKEVFDYKSKYLPGLSRKITPIDLPENLIEDIRNKAEELYSYFRFNTYARLDGFITKTGTVYLNDPNTTSGMMPSSFFFHQAAEIGLNPSQFLTFILYTSLIERVETSVENSRYQFIYNQLKAAIENPNKQGAEKKRIAVVMGGYSTERHISMESGRNIYEKLASSVKYEPFPVFVTGSDESYSLYKLPVNMMLKDNADDIAEKVANYHPNKYLQKIIAECQPILQLFSGGSSFDAEPHLITVDDLATMADGVFIALHGRPGEDGAIQKELERVGLPYNGSGIESSLITINKYDTAEVLAAHGFSVAPHFLAKKEDWLANSKAFYDKILAVTGLPMIAKPADDGCSSAVKKIKTIEQLDAFARLMFREQPQRDAELEKTLSLSAKEEFPQKAYFLAEKFIDKSDAKIFLEVTGGLLTHHKNGGIEYEMFEPSETLAEKEILSLEEKFLAGQGQNITPARYAKEPTLNKNIAEAVKTELKRAAQLLKIEGYARIDAFVKVDNNDKTEVIFIEVNSLPGMTPATCIFHQSALNGYMPYEFIDKILEYGFEKNKTLQAS
jgi:UDP-N-acetylmuramate--alanine ligase